MKKNYSLILIITFFFLSFQNSNNNFDHGIVEGHQYKNHFLGLSLTVPNDWQIADKKQLEIIYNMRHHEQTNGDKKTKPIVKDQEVTHAILFYATKHLATETEPSLPSIFLMAENLKNTPQIKTGKDYLIAPNTLNMSFRNYPYKINDIKKTSIGSKEFYAVREKNLILKHELTKVTSSTIINGFSLTIVVGFENKAQEDEIIEVLKNITFN